MPRRFCTWWPISCAYIGLGELAGAVGRAGVEAVPHLVEELGVEIDLLVVWAIERPHRRLRRAAGRHRAAAEQDEPRRLVARARLLEDLRPGVLGRAQDLRHEPPGFVARRALL